MSDQPFVDLASLGTTIDSADALLAAKKFENAVSAYQAAGAQSANLGAEIPAAKPSADALNAQLQALSSNLASEATATQAQSLAKQILALYTQAAASLPPPTTAPVVAPAGDVTTTAPAESIWPKVFLGAIIVFGVGGLFYVMARGPEMFMKNPTRGSGGPLGNRKPIKHSLINKGRSCNFIMKEGGNYSCRGGMLHDPSGRWWPKTSVLCGPFKKVRAAGPDDGSPQSRHYLGDSHRAVVGVVDTPPRTLSGWTYLGEVDEIRYTRTGRKRPGRYFHEFSKPTALATLIKGKAKARLYRYGRFYRLDLPRDAILDSRGFVFP